ncbi:hypothetical protein QQP08_003689, partial [Theobroma cacao]
FAVSTYELQRKLVQCVAAVDSSSCITSSFSLITPNFTVFQVKEVKVSEEEELHSCWRRCPAAEAPAVEEKKKEEKVKESDDEDMGFSLSD